MGVEAAPAVESADGRRSWWESRWCLALVVLATMLPLAYPQVPRDKFDFVWLLNPMVFDQRLAGDLQPVWRGPGSTLYRIAHVPEGSRRNGQLSAPR